MNVKHKLAIYAVIMLLVLSIIISWILTVREKNNFLAVTLTVSILAALIIFLFLLRNILILTYERKLAEEKIHQMAYFDTLTGLPNRTLFFDRFTIAAANAVRKKRMVAIFFLDLDNFKTVNDTLGHTYGDKLLADVGNHLKKQIRKSDTIARLGGDEFVLMQTNVKDAGEVIHMASRLLNSFKKSWTLEGREFFITASIGITIFPDDGQDIQALMRNADTAMYRAKELGKNNFQLFTESLNQRMLEKLNLENALRKSLEREELVMHYQPQLELKTGKTVGIEALLRWNHPEYGLLYPSTFMPLAEETGMIVPIGEWVFRTACRKIGKLHEEGNTGLKMSINISARQFMQAHMLDKIAEIIEETGIYPEWLELEVTENIAMQDLNFTLDTLNKAKKMGMSIALDDFGGGYSSLNYLTKLPIDNLKMDRAFVGDMKEGTDEAIIGKALITLAHNLDLKVTAEGVETMEKYRLLMNEGCDRVQGYLFGHPLPEEALENNKILKEYVKAHENI